MKTILQRASLYLNNVSDLLACPFCRELFAPNEAALCPQCEVALKPLAELPPSHDLLLDDETAHTPPEHELFAWHALGRGRGNLIVLALAGLAVFFAPWLHEQAPEIRTLSGFSFARELPWLWAAFVAWLVMLGVAASRRSIAQMRGARLAIMMMAGMVLMTVIARIVLKPPSHPLIARRYHWGWGLYAAGFLALLSLRYGWTFGGSLQDMPTRQARPQSEALH